jgi:putative transposase
MSKKIRLKPTTEQEILFMKSVDVARWAYNYLLSEKQRVYDEYLQNGKSGRRDISEGEVRKYINNVLKPTTHTWLKEVSNNVMKQAVKDADGAYKRFFSGQSGKPKFKSKKRSKLSFYVNYESLSRQPNGFRGERIGFVKTSEPLPKLKPNEKYSNPRISFDGKYWYLSIGYNVEDIECTLTDKSLGIDLGIKDLAICSDGKIFKNINKTKRVRELKKRLKREQRKFSKMINGNIDKLTVNHKPIYKKPLEECKNIQKQKERIKLIYRKLTNIRNNYIHQTTSEIVKAKPFQIVMEGLNVKQMMKNKHLAEAISDEKFYEFIRQMKYKSQRYGITFIQVDRFYPSSKMCSRCGNIKRDLKLSDRTYKCDVCGLVIDRDYNASINLANYKAV